MSRQPPPLVADDLPRFHELFTPVLAVLDADAILGSRVFEDA